METKEDIRQICTKKITELFSNIKKLEEKPESKPQLDTLYEEFREVLKVCKPYFKN